MATRLQRRVAEYLAQSNCELPKCLTVGEKNGKPVWVGKSGRHYALWPYGASAVWISLRFAQQKEEEWQAQQEEQRHGNVSHSDPD